MREKLYKMDLDVGYYQKQAQNKPHKEKSYMENAGKKFYWLDERWMNDIEMGPDRF